MTQARVAGRMATAAAALALAMIVGCKRGPPPEQVAQAQRARAQALVDAPCPPTGLWKACDVSERLYRGGLGIRLDSVPASDSVTGIPGMLFHIGQATLSVYIFPDEAARKAAASHLNTSGFVGYMDSQGYPPRPSLLETVNLLAILVSPNDRQRERIGDAVMAGPPMPAKH